MNLVHASPTSRKCVQSVDSRVDDNAGTSNWLSTLCGVLHAASNQRKVLQNGGWYCRVAGTAEQWLILQYSEPNVFSNWVSALTRQNAQSETTHPHSLRPLEPWPTVHSSRMLAFDWFVFVKRHTHLT